MDNKLKVVESIGNVFDAPPSTLIIHACNCQGSWGAGIAKEFREIYPCAYTDYAYVCNQYKAEILGKSHLVLPTSIYENGLTEDVTNKHFIGCIFTSYFYGKLKGSKYEILTATKSSIIDLLYKVEYWNKHAKEYTKIKEIRMCKINSGLFGIPWNETKAVLSSISLSTTITTINVISL